MCCGLGVSFCRYTAEIEYPSSLFSCTAKSVAVCHAFSPPYDPADTAHSFILPCRDGVALVEIFRQAVHIHEPAMPSHNVPDFACPAEGPNIGRR